MLAARRGMAPRSGPAHLPVRLAGTGLAVILIAGVASTTAAPVAAAPRAATPVTPAAVGSAGAAALPLTTAGRLGDAHPVPGSALGEVWCQPGGTSCMAAGYRQTNSTSYTLTMRWNRSRWAVVPSPNPSSGTYSGFTDMTCTSADNCFAGGHYFDPNSTVLIEHWNGSAWSIDRTPNPPGTPSDYIYGIGCATSASCFAVGDAFTAHLGAEDPLTEYWNGSAWSIVPAVRPAGTNVTVFGDVACPAVGDCLAVGTYGADNGYDHLVEQWNGTAWKIVPNPLSNIPGYLEGITCYSTSDCWASGFTEAASYSAVIEHWNGNEWSVVPTPLPARATASFAGNMTCLSTTNCWSGGRYLIGKAPYTLVEHWNGHAWAIVPAPTPRDTSSNGLGSVSCTAPADCVAVGTTETVPPRYHTFAEHWNGSTWAIVPTPYGRPARSDRRDLR